MGRAADAKGTTTGKATPLNPKTRIGLVVSFVLVALPLWFASPAYLPSDYVSSWFAERGPSVEADDVLATCATHRYSSAIVSLDPLVVYISDFVSREEAEALVEIGSPDFAASFISRSRGANVPVTGRTSTSAPLDPSHPLVSCILARARHFMGSMLLPHEPFSVPQLVKYAAGQKYDLHTDFWPEHQVMNDGSERLFNRVASFFVFMRANCSGGETYFPLVEPLGTSVEDPATEEQLEKWFGDKITRGSIGGEDKGLKFTPIVGNAVFWVNLKGDGEGDRRLVHAGLPVGEGEKIGLNIWPRKFFGREGGEEVQRQKKAWSEKWKE